MQWTFHLTSFLRMLAKIAHGYAVGELEIGSFHHMLPKVILWERPELAQHLIGLSGDGFMPIVGKNMFVPNPSVSNSMYTAHKCHIKLLRRETDYLVVVGICLFAAHGTPFYECVAGPLTVPACIRLGLPLPNQNL
jgi:hypothetical protein